MEEWLNRLYLVFVKKYASLLVFGYSFVDSFYSEMSVPKAVILVITICFSATAIAVEEKENKVEKSKKLKILGLLILGVALAFYVNNDSSQEEECKRLQCSTISEEEN